MRHPARTLLGLAFLSVAGCEVVPSSDDVALGDEITAEQRAAFAETTGLDLPASAVWHAYAAHASLDQSVSALVTVPGPAADALLARPPLADADWRDADDLADVEAVLAGWPTPVAGGERGRVAVVDLAPGRHLRVEMHGEGPRTLRISWSTS